MIIFRSWPAQHSIAHLNEASERPRKILKARLVREGSDPVLESLVPVLHEVFWASRVDARSKVTCLIGKRIHNELSPFARERSDKIFRKGRVGEDEVGDCFIDQDNQVAHALVGNV